LGAKTCHKSQKHSHTLGLHVGAALVHLVVYRDRVMQRMLPGLAD